MIRKINLQLPVTVTLKKTFIIPIESMESPSWKKSNFFYIFRLLYHARHIFGLSGK